MPRRARQLRLWLIGAAVVAIVLAVGVVFGLGVAIGMALLSGPAWLPTATGLLIIVTSLFVGGLVFELGRWTARIETDSSWFGRD